MHAAGKSQGERPHMANNVKNQSKLSCAASPFPTGWGQRGQWQNNSLAGVYGLEMAVDPWAKRRAKEGFEAEVPWVVRARVVGARTSDAVYAYRHGVYSGYGYCHGYLLAELSLTGHSSWLYNRTPLELESVSCRIVKSLLCGVIENRDQPIEKSRTSCRSCRLGFEAFFTTVDKTELLNGKWKNQWISIGM